MLTFLKYISVVGGITLAIFWGAFIISEFREKIAVFWNKIWEPVPDIVKINIAVFMIGAIAGAMFWFVAYISDSPPDIYKFCAENNVTCLPNPPKNQY